MRLRTREPHTDHSVELCRLGSYTPARHQRRNEECVARKHRFFWRGSVSHIFCNTVDCECENANANANAIPPPILGYASAFRMGLERVPRPPSLSEARGAPLENTVSLAEPSMCLIFHMCLTRAYHPGWYGASKGRTLTRSRCPLRTAPWESGDSHPGGGHSFVILPTLSCS